MLAARAVSCSPARLRLNLNTYKASGGIEIKNSKAPPFVRRGQRMGHPQHSWCVICGPPSQLLGAGVSPKDKGEASVASEATACRPKGRRYKCPARALTKNLRFHTDSSGAASPEITPANVPTFQVLLGGEHEDAILAGEAHLLQFSVGPEKNGIVASFLSALFPVSRHFGHELAVLLNCDFGAIDEQAVFAGGKLRGAQLGRLRDVDSLADRFGQDGDRQGHDPQQRDEPNQGIVSHDGHFSLFTFPDN